MIWKCFRVDPTHADGWKVIICQILGHLLHQSSLTQKHYSIATRSSNRKLANLIGLSKERPKTDLWPAETQLFGLPWLRWFHLSIINQQVGRQTLIHARLTPFIHRQTKQHSPLSKNGNEDRVRGHHAPVRLQVHPQLQGDRCAVGHLHHLLCHHRHRGIRDTRWANSVSFIGNSSVTDLLYAPLFQSGSVIRTTMELVAWASGSSASGTRSSTTAVDDGRASSKCPHSRFR